MYKLTYESDEDILGQGLDENGTSDQAKKRENEAVIFDKSDLAYSQNRWSPYPDYTAPNVERLSKSETLASTVNAAYGIENKGNSKASAKTEGKNKFYSLFYNSSTESIPTKGKSHSSHSGCRLCILVVYLLLLTAAIAASFVNVYQLRNESFVLKNRLRILEHSITQSNAYHFKVTRSKMSSGETKGMSFSTTHEKAYKAKLSAHEHNNEQRSRTTSLKSDAREPSASSLLNSDNTNDTALPATQLSSDQNQYNATACCDTFQRSLEALNSKVSQSASSMLRDIQKVDANLSFEAISRISVLEEKMTKLALNLRKSVKAERKAGLHMMNLKHRLETLKDEQPQNLKQRTVAFHAHGASKDIFQNIHEKPMVNFLEDWQQTPSLPVDLSYNYELVNRRQDMNPDTGVFTVPFDGYYAFQISFCTTRKGGNASVALMLDNASVRTFRAPKIPSSTETFSIGMDPEIGNSGNTESSTRRHNYSTILQLHKAGKIKLQLVSGSIVETTNGNGLESQSCTEFSGFKIS